MLRCPVLALFVLTLIGCSAGAEENAISAQTKAALEKAEQWELFSLSPDRNRSQAPAPMPPTATSDPTAVTPQPATAAPPAAEAFHDWRVLGKTTLKDPEVRQKLAAAFLKGVAENTGIAAACFNPRHGIRMVHDGQTIDLVICFECYQVAEYIGDKRAPGCLITDSPQPTFDGVLKGAKVPLPEKRK